MVRIRKVVRVAGWIGRYLDQVCMNVDWKLPSRPIWWGFGTDEVIAPLICGGLFPYPAYEDDRQ